MKMKGTAAVVAVAFASSVAAQDESNGQLLRKPSFGEVDPRRVVVKEERSDRRDSKMDSLDGQIDDDAIEKYEKSFAVLIDKFNSEQRIKRHLRSLSTDIEEQFAPGACATIATGLRSRSKPTTLRQLIVVLILFLIVFGSLYSLVEYLLVASRASAACSISTVYIPVTYTITAGMSNYSSTVLASPASISSSGVQSVSYTATSTEIITSYVTVGPASGSSSFTTAPYVYTVDPSGTTHWVNGVSPSSGAPLVTETTTVLVPAGSSSASQVDLASASTEAETATLTAAPYTSTTYVYGSPDTTVTSTSTSTNYVTYTISPASLSGVHTRSSFSGIANGGWNATTSAAGLVPASALTSLLDPQSTTLTSVGYQSSGDPSTSTSTTFITTTIAVRYTVTVTRSSSAPFVTTITALPVTLTDPSGSQSTMTAAQPSSEVSPVAISSISTTVNMSAVTAATGSLTGIASASESLGSSSTEPYPYSVVVGSSVVPVQSSSTTAPSNSSIAGAITATLSSTSSYASGNASTVTAGTPMLSSSSSVQITNTMSSSTSQSASMASAVNGSAISASSGAMTGLSSQSSEVPPISSTISSSSSDTIVTSSAPASSVAASSSTNNGSKPISSISSTLITLTTANGSSIAGPISSSTSSNGASTLLSSSSLQTYSSMSQVASSSTATKSSTSRTADASNHSGSASSSSVAPTSSAQGTAASNHSSSPAATTSVSIAHTMSGPSHSASVSTATTATSINGTAGASTSKSVHSVTSASAHSQSSKSATNRASRTSPFMSSSNSVSASSATATPSAGCGEHGDFMVDFDNLPNFMPTNQNSTDITQAPPIPNPYYHLTFSDGYVYAPQPAEPFTPESSPHLAVFLATGAGKRVSTPFGNYSKPGEISDGPRESISAFWFDARSAFLGCDNAGPELCTIMISAYRWSSAANDEVLAHKQNATLAPCTSRKGCELQQVNFPDDEYRDLTGLQMQAFVGKEEKMFFMDDLALRWSNNTCAAGLLRQSSQ